MESIKEKMRTAISENDYPALETLLHAWAAGAITSNELDDALAMHKRTAERRKEVASV